MSSTAGRSFTTSLTAAPSLPICPVCQYPATFSWLDVYGYRHYSHEQTMTAVTPNECIAAAQEQEE